jgi:hypothetical protein
MFLLSTTQPNAPWSPKGGANTQVLLNSGSFLSCAWDPL